ncbi:MAG TPA: class I SAM-dependent methyltransferase [Candidatus Dormibacteraeota bacterium]|nr:class I SAM-dependent methyltransferase [Candidatus Dormibacteraeota bacterium]
MDANTEQERFWNDEAGPAWVEHQERLDTLVRPFGRLSLDAGAPAPGESVLDAGCGTGATVLELAVRTGPAGRVLGVDISKVMLDRARSRVAEAGLGTVELVRADAQVAALPVGAFHLVHSRFGVMFFADPVAAFANLRSALRPEGRLAFVCWQAPDRNPWFSVPIAAVSGILEPPPAPGPGAPSPFALADAGVTRAILERAGFSEIAIEGRERPVRFAGAGEGDRAGEIALSVLPVRAAYAAAAPELRRRARTAVQTALAPFAGPDGVALPGSAWVVTARR